MLRFRALGFLEVYRDGTVVPAMSALLLRRLLAALLCRPNETVPVGDLIAALWGDDPPPTAHRTLLVYVRRLRIALGANDRIMREPAGYRVVVRPGELDAADFTRLVAEAGAAAGNDGEDGARAFDLLSEALQLWQGEAFGDVRDHAPIADHARTLDEERARVEEWRARLGLEAGLHAELIPRLTELVESYPYREDFPAHLMLALYRLGRQTEAVAVFHRTRQLLAAELGIEPGSQLRDLVARILQGDPALALHPAMAQGRNFLPRDIPYFAGRSKEIDYLSDLAAEGGATVIQAIDGMAGVGKTALAVHVSHRMAEAYPDGRLFINLHGHTENRDPLTADEALDLLLREAGVVAESRIPGEVDGKSALWRSELAGRRVLVLLDNASSPSQIRPLLPGTRECTVLITSRRRLIGLDGVRVVSLDTLPEGEAIALFTRIAGVGGGDPATIGEVVRMCGLLPLAISIVAARLRSRPSWTVEDLVDRLTDERTRSALLEAEDSGVAAAFSLSYQYLSPVLQRFYRVLGLHPGREIDKHSAAALAAVSSAEAERMLEELCDVHLLNAQRPGCYQFHDLVCEHAAARAAEEETATSRGNARDRLLDYYLHVSELAADQISPVRRKLGPVPQRPPADVPRIGDLAEAVAWFEAEHANLVPLVRLADRHSAAQHAWQIPRNCAVYLSRGGYVALTKQLLETATTAAARPGSDPGALPTCLVNLGMVVNDLGEYRTGLEYVKRAIAHAQSVGDRDGETALLGYLAEGLMRTGRYREAADVAFEAAEAYRAQGNWGREAIALGLQLLSLTQLGQAEEALRAMEHGSREIATLELDRIGCILFEAVGIAYSRAGLHDLALDYLRRGIEATRMMNDTVYEGSRLHRLAEAERRAGLPVEALRHAMRAHHLLGENPSINDIVESQNTLGAIHLDLGRHDEALAHFTTALATAESKEVHLERARAIEGIGDALAAQGDLAAARQRWGQAAEIYDALEVRRR